jgi:hypothetical protein
MEDWVIQGKRRNPTYPFVTNALSQKILRGGFESMRNLKKLLAVIVAVAFMISAMVPAFATPADVVGTDYEDEVARLVALGIITGREDGNFYPDETITRAEFAAVVVRALGYGSAADAAKGTTKFSDVPATNWASGYVNLANNLGIINGRPDGTFGANDPVRYEEAVTMIVRALGYEPAAQARGGYPTGYLTIASQEDIDDDAVGAIGQFASRAIVAKMIDNSLEVRMMVQVGYGTETKFVKSGDEGTDPQTIISHKLKLDPVVGIVESVDDDEIEIDGDDYTLFESISSAGLEGAVVEAWYDDDTDIIYSLSVESNTFYDFVEEINGEDDVADFDAEGIDDFDDIEDIRLLNTGKKYDVVENFTLDGDVDVVDDLLNAFAKVVIYEGDIVSIEAYDLDEGGIITALDDKYIEYTRGDVEERRLRGLDDVDSLLVVVDGELAAYEDLEEDMLFDFWNDADDYVVVASSARAEGEISDVDFEDDGTIKIEGKKYDFAGIIDVNDCWYSNDEGDNYDAIESDDDLDELYDVDVVAYIDAAGEIRYIKGDGGESTDDFYGYVERVWAGSDDQIRIFREVDGEGESVTYVLDLDNNSPLDYEDIDRDEFYMFTINSDGEITSVSNEIWLEVGAEDEFTLGSDDFNDDDDAIVIDSANRYVEDAVIFYIDEDGDPQLAKWDDIKEKNPAGAVVKLEASRMSECVIILSGFEDIYADDEFVAFVTARSKYNKDYYRLTMLSTADEFTALIDADDDYVPVKNTFLVYTEDDDDEVKGVGTFSWTATDLDGRADGTISAAEIVYDIDGDFISFDSNPSQYFKVNKDTVVIEKDGSDYDESSLKDIEVDDVVKFYRVGDIIKAILFEEP